MNAIAPRWLELAARLARRVYPTVRRPRWRASRRATAFHEAGHVVTLHHTGRTVTGATIDARRAALGFAGQAYAGSPMPSEQQEMRAADAPLSTAIFPEKGPLVLCWAAMFYAGKESEYRMHGCAPDGFVPGSDPDDREAEWLLSVAFGARRGVTPAAGCQRLARVMVAALWPQIEGVAAALLQHRTLDGPAIRRTMAGERTSDDFPRGVAAADAARPALSAWALPPTVRADLLAAVP